VPPPSHSTTVFPHRGHGQTESPDERRESLDQTVVRPTSSWISITSQTAR
jgi:hypothetical protein